MFSGIDFPGLFESDNFTSRRTTGNNLHDPESLITGGEAALGFTYTNSRRNWVDEWDYHIACGYDLQSRGHGEGFDPYTSEEIARVAPREFLPVLVTDNEASYYVRTGPFANEIVAKALADSSLFESTIERVIPKFECKGRVEQVYQSAQHSLDAESRWNGRAINWVGTIGEFLDAPYDNLGDDSND
jgi:hypothetical protein